MRTVKYLLIGAGLASQRAAARLREKDPDGIILLVGREARPPYDHPPLSKAFLQGKKPEEKVYLAPGTFYTEKRIELALATEVESIDPESRTARLVSHDERPSAGPPETQEVRFEKALLATGGRPRKLGVPGEKLPGVHCLRTLDDAISISQECAPQGQAVGAAAGRRAVVIGGGFIGAELACSLTQRGVAVTLLERGERIWARFASKQLSAYIQDYLTQQGVAVIRHERVAHFGGAGRVRSVTTASGVELPCDFACVAVGIEPELELARGARLEIDNGVVVDEHMRTSHPDLYAAGDIANYPDPYSSRRRRVEHWGSADYQGTLAADNMFAAARGEAGPKYDLLTYVWSDLFDLHVEFAGDETLGEREIVRGRVGDAAFAILCLRGGRMTAYYAANYKGKQLVPFQKLIQSGMDLNGREAQLANPDYDLSKLLTTLSA